MTDDELRTELLARIEMRRSEVRAFLRRGRPRSRRRANATLVFTSLAAVFTIGPAAGGESFSGAVQKVFGLASDSTVWRTLCLLTVLVSAAAAVLTNIGKTRDDAGQIAAAEAVDAELDGLTTLLRYGHLSLDDAVKLYQQYTVKIPFVDAAEPVAVPWAGGPAPEDATGARTQAIPVVPPAGRGGPAAGHRERPGS